MQAKNILFIDRDGTMIVEPEDQQIDSVEKFQLLPGTLAALKEFQKFGFSLVMVSNQDGLGKDVYPEEKFTQIQNLLFGILNSEEIKFDDILICPHFDSEQCQCRKPKTGLLENYIRERKYTLDNSFVIGDRESDLKLAEALNIEGLQIGSKAYPDWLSIKNKILFQSRIAQVSRKSKETDISVKVNLSQQEPVNINTGIGFFDHMLEQIAFHAGFSLIIDAKGDLHIDQHHTVEDVAICFGQALKKALGNKYGVNRYGFTLPMDEAIATVAIDLSGRPYWELDFDLPQSDVGGFSCELVEHFFQTLAVNLGATIHIAMTGKNTHHMIEVIFKAFARALGQAIAFTNQGVPSTKGCL